MQPPTSLPLHRIRFYDHTPSPITALAFAPIPLPAPCDPKQKGKHKSVNVNVNGVGGVKDEFGLLVLARDNGDVEIWEYVSDEGMCGNWDLQKTLPPTLVNPQISSIALVVRDPLNFYRKSYTVPKIEDLRLFTAGSESTELAERCLLSGRVLQTYPIPSPPMWSMSVAPTHDLLCLATSSPSLQFISIPPPLSHKPGPTFLEPPPSHLLRCDALPSRTRTVSIAWGIPILEQTQDTQEWYWRNTHLITGNSDSSWRKWEIPPPLDAGRTGINRVTLKSRAVVEKVAKAGRGGKKAQSGSNRATIVWGVGVLPDNDVVTSDSLGNVTFWDGASMAQRHSFRAHKADGMCMAIGPGGRSVFTSGPDQRVCHFVNASSTNNRPQWMLTATKRIHSHDVRALAIFPPYLSLPSNITSPLANPNYAPVLASGGWDMSLALTSAGSPETSEKSRNALGKLNSTARAVFEESFSRRMGYLAGGRGNDRIIFATKARLVLGRKDRSVGIWRVLNDEQGWEKVLEMELRLRTHLISATISPDGRWLAVSDLYETKVFLLSSITDGSGSLRPTRIKDLVDTLSSELPHLSIPTKGCGASSLLFTPDSAYLVLGLVASGQIAILQLSAGTDKSVAPTVSVTKCFACQDKLVEGRVMKGLNKAASAQVNGHANGNGLPNGHGHGDGHEQDVEMESSDDEVDDEDKDEGERSKVEENPPWVSRLAASDDGQWLAVSDLAGRVSIFNLDTLQLHAALPTLPQTPISLSFPSSAPLLALTHPTNTITFYHLEHRRLLPPTPQLLTLATNLASLHTPICGSTFYPSNKNKKDVKLLLWGADWLVTARLDLDSISRGKGRRNSESPSLSISINGSPASLSASASVVAGGGLGGKAARKKRAREAREQLEHSLSTPNSVTGSVDAESEIALASASLPSVNRSSTGDGEFVKVQRDRYKSLIGVGWLASHIDADVQDGMGMAGDGDGVEVALVERPLADYMDSLPAPFWSGSFGRS